METPRLGKPLFTRTYHRGDGQLLVIRIWNPNKTQVPMFCWYQIGDGNLHRVPGLDPLDALLTAVKTVEMHLKRLQDTQDKGLHWKQAMYEDELGLLSFYPSNKKSE